MQLNVRWEVKLPSGCSPRHDLGVAGPIAAFYLFARRIEKITCGGTVACSVLMINLAKVPFGAQLGLINADSLRFDALLLPTVLAGGVAGRLLLRRVPQRLFELITISLAGAAAIRLIAFN